MRPTLEQQFGRACARLLVGVNRGLDPAGVHACESRPAIPVQFYRQIIHTVFPSLVYGCDVYGYGARGLGLGTLSPVTEELSDLAGLPDWEDGVQSCL